MVGTGWWVVGCLFVFILDVMRVEVWGLVMLVVYVIGSGCDCGVCGWVVLVWVALV